MDEGKIGILQTLLDRLRGELGVDGMVLDWFKSYLADRQQVVTIRGEESDSCRLNFGIPQSPVLGPQLFTVYTMPLGRILRAHDLDYHFFADDSQLYVFF